MEAVMMVLDSPANPLRAGGMGQRSRFRHVLSPLTSGFFQRRAVVSGKYCPQLFPALLGRCTMSRTRARNQENASIMTYRHR